MRDEPIHHGIVCIDIEGFGRAQWTDPMRSRIRKRLHRLVDKALIRAHVKPTMATSSDTGDGLLLLFHGDVSTARLLDPLTTALACSVADDNKRAPTSERMRLRAVVHAGEVLHDAHGHTGAELNFAFRLLNAEATRDVLACSPEAVLVLVVSDVVYQGVVRHGYKGIDPADWRSVRIHAKETRTRAWVHLPGLATDGSHTAQQQGAAARGSPRTTRSAEAPSRGDGYSDRRATVRS